MQPESLSSADLQKNDLCDFTGTIHFDWLWRAVNRCEGLLFERRSEISPAKVSYRGVFELDAIDEIITFVARRRGGIIFEHFDDGAMTTVILFMIRVGLVGDVDADAVARGKSPCHASIRR